MKLASMPALSGIPFHSIYLFFFLIIYSFTSNFVKDTSEVFSC